MSIFIKHTISLFFFCILFLYTPRLRAQDTIPADTIVIPTDSIKIVVEAPDLNLPDSIPQGSTPVPKVTPDTLARAGFISGIEIAIDYLKFAGLILKTETKYEGSLGLILKNKYVLNVDIGEGVLTPARAYRNTTSYKSEGRYSRIGLNYLIVSNEKNILSAGLRYGNSRFSENLTYKTENVFGFTYEETYSKESIKANWYEVTLATEGSLLKNVYAGAIIRLRILGQAKDEGVLSALSIPGYGRAIDKVIPAFNLYIKYRLNF